MKPHLAAVRDFRPTELPTTWDDADGRTVEWSEWSPAIQVFICPAPLPDHCRLCGSAGPKSTAAGKVVPRSGETFEVTEDVASKRVPGRFYERKRMVPAWKVYRLFASRCSDCGGTDIYDKETETVHVPPWDDPSEVTTAPATDVPDTEQPADWHRHRWLTTHGQPTDGCADTCCTTDKEARDA